MQADYEYINLCKTILEKGRFKDDRTGTGTISYFGHQMRFDLQKGFPLLTTKKIPFRLIVGELLWFLKGSSDLADLLDKNINIWNDDAYRDYKSKGGTLDKLDFIEWAHDNGYNLGPIYGSQWRSWKSFYYYESEVSKAAGIAMAGDGYKSQTIDQISNAIHAIKTNPNSRRLIVSAWNVADIDKMALPPCHILFQFYVHDGKLSCQLYQRSGDVFLGVPFNIASYALLTHMIAQACDLKVGEFIHTLGDAHIYVNHINQIKEQISREPYESPTLILDKDIKDIFDFTENNIYLNGYYPHPAIKGNLSVGE